MISFTVLGTPAPQGSKRAFVVKGRAVMVEASKKTVPWRDSVAVAGMTAMGGRPPIEGPVEVQAVFTMPRPKTVKRPLPSVAPDIDKLARTILDGLTAGGVLVDDSLVVKLLASKVYGAVPGATVTVWEVAA